jgi:hypothetical protein
MFKSKLNTIVAVTALGVAVFGSTPLGHAAAGMVLPGNSVGTAQIKKNAVTGLKVKNGSLLAADFKTGQLPAGAQGPKGDTGPAGAQGLKGDAGATGAQGAKGDTGAAGAQGSKGDAGTPGAPGSKGDKGDKGDPGVSAQTYWTKVTLTGTTVGSNTTTTVAHTAGSNGYWVTFDPSISLFNCGISITPLSGGAAEFGYVHPAGANVIDVLAYDSAGQNVEHGFSLVLSC